MAQECHKYHEEQEISLEISKMKTWNITFLMCAYLTNTTLKQIASLLLEQPPVPPEAALSENNVVQVY